MSDVLIIGGTGLLGYYTTLELLDRGYGVTAVSLPPAAIEPALPSAVESVWADLGTLSDTEVLEFLHGKHAVFYAAGADERVTPPAPAARFFYQANVLPTQRLARLAREAGVQKFVLFGSYTAEFGEQWPDLGYRTHNGYPRTRLAQEEVAYLEGDGAMDVMVLRLPYIFGLIGSRRPLWQFVVDQVLSQPETVSVAGGSTSSVTVDQVAQAAVGAMENGTHGERYAINAYELTYKELFQIACRELGRNPDDVVVVPLEAMLPVVEQLDIQLATQGVEHGVHLADSIRFQYRRAVTDPATTMSMLGIKEADVAAAAAETLRWCVQHPVETVPVP
jgi:dihydroflavonol-4-reductase